MAPVLEVADRFSNIRGIAPLCTANGVRELTDFLYSRLRHGQGMPIAQHRSIDDPDLGGSYTVKIYQSRKKTSGECEWEHERITLIPDSTDPKYQPIELDSASAGQVQVIAELIAVLPTDG